MEGPGATLPSQKPCESMAVMFVLKLILVQVCVASIWSALFGLRINEGLSAFCIQILCTV